MSFQIRWDFQLNVRLNFWRESYIMEKNLKVFSENHPFQIWHVLVIVKINIPPQNFFVNF